MHDLDINLLRSFKTIAESGSLSLASLRLHRTQSAVSIQLRKLEEQIGRRLIARGNQKAVLTPDGERLLPYANRMLALSDEAASVFGDKRIKGEIRFGIPDDYASAFLLPVLSRFSTRFPDVKFKIRNTISQYLYSALTDNELDLALVTYRQGADAQTPLKSEKLCWVASDRFNYQPQQPLPLALYSHGCDYRHQILIALSNAHRDYEIVFECSGVTGVNIAVESGLAITAMWESLVQPDWHILDERDYGLPTLGAIALELRYGNDQISPATRCFSNELCRYILGR